MSKKTIKFDKLNINDIIYTDLEDNERVNSQKIGYIRYKKDPTDNNGIQLTIQAPTIKYEAYGIPKEGVYYPTAHKRAYFKFAFSHDRKKYADTINYDDIEKFQNLLVSIDKQVGSDDFRKKLFGEKYAHKYVYSPLVRFKEEDDDDEGQKLDKNGKPYYSPPYTKIKLDLAYNKPDTPPENISTKPMFSIFERKDGTRESVKLNNFDDVLKYITFGSKLRFIISFSKLYAMKSSSGSDKKMYGITLKATHIEVEDYGRENHETNNDDPFESDTEETINTSKITRNISKLDIDDDDDDDVTVQLKPSVSVSHDNMKDDDDDDDDDDEEIVEEPKAKAKQTTKPKAKVAAKSR